MQTFKDFCPFSSICESGIFFINETFFSHYFFLSSEINKIMSLFTMFFTFTCFFSIASKDNKITNTNTRLHNLAGKIPSFQAQFSFTSWEGGKYLRVITNLQDTTRDREEAENGSPKLHTQYWRWKCVLSGDNLMHTNHRHWDDGYMKGKNINGLVIAIIFSELRRDFNSASVKMYVCWLSADMGLNILGVVSLKTISKAVVTKDAKTIWDDVKAKKNKNFYKKS